MKYGFSVKTDDERHIDELLENVGQIEDEAERLRLQIQVESLQILQQVMDGVHDIQVSLETILENQI